MAEPGPSAKRWLSAFGYVGLMCVILLIHILPIHIGPDLIPGPDLMLAITFIWLLRRPHYLPTPLVAAVFLVADLLLMRPPGLWTALVVIAVEILRSREAASRERAFGVEWASVAVLITGIALANYLILAIFLVDHSALGLVLLQVLVTLMIYPALALAAGAIFGIDRLSPGDLNAMGGRL